MTMFCLPFSFNICWNWSYRSSRPELFCKKSLLRNFTKFTGKHLRQSLFFNKIAGHRQQVFSCEFCKISENTLSYIFVLTEHLPAVASNYRRIKLLIQYAFFHEQLRSGLSPQSCLCFQGFPGSKLVIGYLAAWKSNLCLQGKQ